MAMGQGASQLQAKGDAAGALVLFEKAASLEPDSSLASGTR